MTFPGFNPHDQDTQSPENRLAGVNHHLTPGAHPSFEALSSWRANDLATDEGRRIQAHVADCSTCQRLIADFETMDMALCRFEPDGALVARVASLDIPRLSVSVRSPTNATHRQKSRAAEEEHTELDVVEDHKHVETPAFARKPRPRRRAWVSSALAAVAILALTLGFLAAFQWRATITNVYTYTHTYAPIKTGRLTWRPLVIPPWAPAHPNASDIGYAVNGKIVYLYISPPQLYGGLWMTTDFGQHWRHLPPPPVAFNAGTPHIIQDDGNPYTVSLFFEPTDSSQNMRATEWVLFDTRMSRPAWQSLSSPVPESLIEDRITWHNLTYELVDSTSNTAPNGKLLVSNDRMRSWKTIPTPAWVANSLWIQMTTGQLLIEGSKNSSGGEALWLRSLTNGHWSRITAPAYTLLSDGTSAASASASVKDATSAKMGAVYYVAQPSSEKTFSICAEITTTGASGPENPEKSAYACSWDSGQHWQRRPQLYVPCTVTNLCAPGQQSISLEQLHVTPSGETIAFDGLIDNGRGAVSVFLLPRQATSERQWEDIGDVPQVGSSGYGIGTRPHDASHDVLILNFGDRYKPGLVIGYAAVIP
ncbi:MAG TPA: hypothetical protein VKQ36_10590 [Ktedonobacterales bacterium]|nr:hypothetical protein [Ktedonobacterales bacterium]